MATANKGNGVPRDILDDISSRFLVNMPLEERSIPVRVCFQAEEAHWFYLDFYCGNKDYPQCKNLGVREFIRLLFFHCDFLKEHQADVDNIINEWREYKRDVPTCGALILNLDNTKVLCVQGFYSKNTWGFPKGKQNQDETSEACAIREVLEEVGLDVGPMLNPRIYLERVIGEISVRLYIVRGVPDNYAFATKTRKEIRAIKWFNLADLPEERNDLSKTHFGFYPNHFYTAVPFISDLKYWINAGFPSPMEGVMTDELMKYGKGKVTVRGGLSRQKYIRLVEDSLALRITAHYSLVYQCMLSILMNLRRSLGSVDALCMTYRLHEKIERVYLGGHRRTVLHILLFNGMLIKIPFHMVRLHKWTSLLYPVNFIFDHWDRMEYYKVESMLYKKDTVPKNMVYVTDYRYMQFMYTVVEDCVNLSFAPTDILHDYVVGPHCQELPEIQWLFCDDEEDYNLRCIGNCYIHDIEYDQLLQIGMPLNQDYCTIVMKTLLWICVERLSSYIIDWRNRDMRANMYREFSIPRRCFLCGRDPNSIVLLYCECSAWRGVLARGLRGGFEFEHTNEECFTEIVPANHIWTHVMFEELLRHLSRSYFIKRKKYARGINPRYTGVKRAFVPNNPRRYVHCYRADMLYSCAGPRSEND